MQVPNFRPNGAKGALLDEYERALGDLKRVIAEIPPLKLQSIVDEETTDPDCKSIQTILTHVVRSAFGYAIYIRKHAGEAIEFRVSKPCNTSQEYIEELDAAFAFTEQTFELYPALELESFDANQKMRVRWGQLYDIEQIIEHAIVHILRHRRQIERFLLKLG